MGLRQHSQNASDRFLEILKQGTSAAQKREQENLAGLKKSTGVELPESARSPVPRQPESIDTLPQELADLTPGDPKNTAILDRTYKQLAGEIEALSNVKEQGVLEGLKGPRKWRVAMQMALNPGMRRNANARLREAREEAVHKRRQLMLQIGIELRNREVDPVRKEYYVNLANKLGEQRGEEIVQDRKNELADDAVRRGVIDQYDREQLDRMGLGLKEKSRVPVDTQLKSNLTILNGSLRAVHGLSSAGAQNYGDLLREMGLRVNETWQRQLEMTAAANPKKKSAGEETPAAEKARLNREARANWKVNVDLIKEFSKELVWVNEEQMKAFDPDATSEDDGAIKRYISTWTPEEILSGALRLSEMSDLPRELYRQFFNGESGGSGGEDDDFTLTDAELEELESKLNQ